MCNLNTDIFVHYSFSSIGLLDQALQDICLYNLATYVLCNVYKTYFIQNTRDVDLQPDQKNMVVLFWHLVKCDTTIRTVAYTGQVTFHKVLESHGHV